MLLPIFLLACRPEPPPPTPQLDGAVVGIDVSAHQDAIDWEAVAADGVHFAFIKATEGSTFTDERFVDNWAEARAAGVRVGAYHYFSACRGGEDQAQHFLDVVSAAEAQLPSVVDVEPDARCNRGTRWTNAPREVALWLDAVEDATGTRPLVYGSDHVQRDHLADLDAERWVAAYSRVPSVPSWSVWQHTERGQIAGIDGPVDRNLATAAWWSAQID